MMNGVVKEEIQTNGLVDQSHSPGNLDEVERVRQKNRMEALRKRHEESIDIYNRTQPAINEQIQQETMKYLKSGQANGTKTKSQKPRAPKRQRSTTTSSTSSNNSNNNNTNNNTNNNNNINNNSPINIVNNNNIIINNGIVTKHNSTVAQPHTIVNSTSNGLPPQPQLHQATPSSQGGIVQHGHMQQINIYPQGNQIQQQPAMHVPQHQHQMQPQQQHFKYQAPANNIYQQPQQTTMQHQYQTQQQTQQVYSQPQQLQQPPSHLHPQQIEQGHYVVQRPPQPSLQQSQQHFAQHHTHLNGTHHLHHHHPHQIHVNHVPNTSLPNDLDLNIQAGLECDIDSLIKHEMSVEGQLDFNNELLLKLDSHFHHPHQ